MIESLLQTTDLEIHDANYKRLLTRKAEKLKAAREQYVLPKRNASVFLKALLLHGQQV